MSGIFASSSSSAFSNIDVDMPARDTVKTFLMMGVFGTIILNAYNMHLRLQKAEKIFKKMPGKGKDMSLIPAEMRDRMGDVAGLSTSENWFVSAVGVGLLLAMAIMP
jgi:hypothetical protein